MDAMGNKERIVILWVANSTINQESSMVRDHQKSKYYSKKKKTVVVLWL